MLLYKQRMGRSVYAYPHLLRHTHTQNLKIKSNLCIHHNIAAVKANAGISQYLLIAGIMRV